MRILSKSKGQVTLFVIIGIVIIIIVGLVFYLTEGKKTEVNFAKDPLEDIMRFELESCIGTIANQRLNDAMTKGG